MKLPNCPINASHIVKENIYFPKMTIYFCTHCKEDIEFLKNNPGYEPPKKPFELPLKLQNHPNPTHQIKVSNVNTNNEIYIKDVLETILDIDKSIAQAIIETSKTQPVVCFKANLEQCVKIFKAIENHCNLLENVYSFNYAISSCFQVENI